LQRLALAVNTEQLFDSHFGVSSRNVVALFRGSENLFPAIIFLDECDSIVCRRTSGESGANQEANRMANTLLQALDEDRTNHIWVLATNRPGVIDSAFHRRINRAIHFPLPTQEVIRAMLAAWWLEADWACLDNPTLSALSLSAHGLSHAEMRASFNQVWIDSVLGRLVGQDEAQALLGFLEKRKTITHGK
jgi:ATP-dependent 26S proteasome regulatory subunit